MYQKTTWHLTSSCINCSSLRDQGRPHNPLHFFKIIMSKLERKVDFLETFVIFWFAYLIGFLRARSWYHFTCPRLTRGDAGSRSRKSANTSDDSVFISYISGTVDVLTLIGIYCISGSIFRSVAADPLYRKTESEVRFQECRNVG